MSPIHHCSPPSITWKRGRNSTSGSIVSSNASPSRRLTASNPRLSASMFSCDVTCAVSRGGGEGAAPALPTQKPPDAKYLASLRSSHSRLGDRYSSSRWSSASALSSSNSSWKVGPKTPSGSSLSVLSSPSPSRSNIQKQPSQSTATTSGASPSSTFSNTDGSSICPATNSPRRDSDKPRPDALLGATNHQVRGDLPRRIRLLRLPARFRTQRA